MRSDAASYLTPLHADSTPQTCIVMDTEIEHDHCGGDAPGAYWAKTVSGIRWRYEDGKVCRMSEAATLLPELWWDWVARQCRKGAVTWLLAYDLLRQLRCNGMMKLLSQGSWALTENGEETRSCGLKQWKGLAILNDPPTVLIVRPPGKRGTLQLVDLRNYGIASRAEIGKPETWLYYAERWVKSVVEWIRSNHLGSLQLTAASQAMHTFRRRFLDDKIECWRIDEVNKMEQAAFYGGKCECYRLGKTEGPIYHLDVNSLYPAVCRDLPVPIEMLHSYEGWEVPAIDLLHPAIQCLATVEIKTEVPQYPLRRGGLVVYPIGKFWTVLSGPELLVASEANCIEDIASMQTYRCEPILHDYMTWLYDQRMQARKRGDAATEQLIKRMLVGLPGKFIQQGRTWQPDKARKATQPWRLWREVDSASHTVTQYRSFGWQVQREKIEGLAPTAIPAIGAWITSAGRVWMRELIGKLPARSLLYSDTDSLWVTEPGYTALKMHGLVDNELIGMLKLVETVECLDVRGIKHYVADGRIVRSGVALRAGQPVQYSNCNTVIRHVNADLALRQAPQNVDVVSTREVEQPYKHGAIGEDGWIQPWRLNG